MSKPGRIYLSPKANSISVSLDHRRIFALDAAGRLVYAYIEGNGFKRGLDGRLLEKEPIRDADGLTRIRRDLPEGEKARFYAAMQADLARARAAATAGEAVVVDGSLPAHVLPWLDRALGRDAAADQAEAAAFHYIYRPVSILPPDQYLAVVVQATEGCSWNQCTFCTFYRDQKFRIKTPAEFKSHVSAVRSLLGPGLSLRRSLFLADANALIIPQPQLRDLLRIARAEFPVLPARLTGARRQRWLQRHPEHVTGIYSFIDVVSGLRKTPDDWAELAKLGLRRVYLGAETGSADLLRWLNKPGSPEGMLALIAQLQAAGIGVGLIVMAGVGGERFADSHLHGTVDLLRQVRWGEPDILYISEFVEHPGSDYERRAWLDSVRPLSPGDVAAQTRAFRAAARAAGARRVAPYDIREFIY